jgi:diguanylate cyclase (GGDEF)-like protein
VILVAVGACERGWRSGGALLCLLLAWVVPANTQAVSLPDASIPDLDRAQLLSWMDAPAALQLLDRLQPTAQTGDALVQWLMARGMGYGGDGGDQEQAQAIIQRLHELGATRASAEAAAHILRSFQYERAAQYERADAELTLIGAEAALPAFERFRLLDLRGTIHMLLGRHEAALSDYERARDLATAMHSPSCVIEAMIHLAGFYVTTRDLERAASLAAQLRTTVQQTGDDILWVEVADLEGDIADARGDRAEQRRALLEALSHAQRGGSERSMAMVLVDLGDFNLTTGSYAAAVDYSTRAVALARKLRRPLFEQLAHFSLGMAQIGLGHAPSGKREVDSAIQQALASGDLHDADDMMRRYRTTLEKVGDLRGALEVTHRDDTVRDQLAVTAREKALLELSAKFDDERRARRTELLERDSAFKSRDLLAQRLRLQMIVMAAALIALACGALLWGIVQIRKVNARLLHNIQHDAVTGLLNRRYFNEHILAGQADRAYVGCLLLIGVDKAEYINDAWGYVGGDGIVSVVAKRLSSALRDSDALVRWAGEVFLVLTGPMSDAQLNLAVRRALIAICSEPIAWNGHSMECTVSIGYASFPVEGTAVDISLDRAITLVDNAWRQAKRQGGNRACLISQVSADSERELSAIIAQFEVATLDRRVQLVETMGATMPSSEYPTAGC